MREGSLKARGSPNTAAGSMLKQTLPVIATISSWHTIFRDGSSASFEDLSLRISPSPATTASAMATTASRKLELTRRFRLPCPSNCIPCFRVVVFQRKSSSHARAAPHSVIWRSMFKLQIIIRYLFVGEPTGHCICRTMSLVVRFLKYVHFTMWCRSIPSPPQYLQVQRLFTFTKKSPRVQILWWNP